MNQESKQPLNLHEFFVEGNDQSLSHVLLHITEPSTDEERKKGYFFALCEIKNPNEDFIFKLQNEIDNFENKYYSNEEENPAEIFEKNLEELNEKKYLFLRDNENIHINIVIGIITPPQIIFAFHGNPLLFLFYKGKDDDYQKMDLCKENQPDDGKILFSQIVQGKISKNDYFFIGTPNIENYFDTDRIKKIITTRSPNQGAEHIGRILADLKNEHSFGGMVINMDDTPTTERATSKLRPEHESGAINSLFAAEQKTAATLSPSLINQFGHKIQAMSKSGSEQEMNRNNPTYTPKNRPFGGAHTRTRPSTQTAQDDFFAGKLLIYSRQAILWLLQGLWWLAKTIIAIVKFIFQLLLELFLVTTNWRSKRRMVADGWQRAWRNQKDMFRSLSLMRKIILSLIFLAAILLVSGVFWLRANQKTKEARTLFDNQFKMAENKKDVAESALIYRDEAAAMDALVAARQILSKLDCQKTEIENCAQLANSLQKIAVKLQKINTVSTKLLTDWGQLSDTLLPDKIIKIGNKILGYSVSSSDIFVYDLNSQIARKLAFSFGTEDNGFIAATVPKENDYALFVDRSGDIYQYDTKTDGLNKIEIAFPSENSLITALLVYNRRLYTLDEKNHLILRHDVIKTGFATGKEWLKSQSNDLEHVADMAVDGDIYALKNNGTLLKFSAGQPESFSLQAIDPPLNSANAIYTYNDTANIYILDSQNDRLAIFDKTGKLLKQLKSDSITNPVGMIIDESAKTAFVLNEGKILQIDL